MLLSIYFSPSLTWRDTQHIVLRTANPTPLLNNPGWSVNGGIVVDNNVNG